MGKIVMKIYVWFGRWLPKQNDLRSNFVLQPNHGSHQQKIFEKCEDFRRRWLVVGNKLQQLEFFGFRKELVLVLGLSYEQKF